MKRLLGSFIALTLLASTALGCSLGGCSTSGSCSTSCGDCCTSTCAPKTQLTLRSQGDYLPLNAHYNFYQYGEECFYGDFSVNYRYERSFRDERLASALFGSNVLNFKGSAPVSPATRDNTKDLIADYFGLATDTDLAYKFCPKIQNHVFDFNLYLGLNELIDGLYLQVNVPFVHAKWELNHSCDDCCNDCCTTSTTTNTSFSTKKFNAGYMDSITAGDITPHNTWAKALGGAAFGDVKAWNYAKILGCCECTENALAGIHVDLGYNIFDCPDYHFGIYLKGVAPAGVTRIDNCYQSQVFQPAVGYDHWELGAGLTGHVNLYNCDDEHTVDLLFQGYLTHLFEREQTRVFDLKNSALSRYMLLKEFSADKSYAGNLYSATEFTTRRTKVRIDIKGEGQLELRYKNDCGFSAGLGYNLYGRSDEKAANDCCLCSSVSKSFGIKGCAPVAAKGWATGTNTGDDWVETTNAESKDYALNSTQSAATIYTCAAVDNAKKLALFHHAANLTGDTDVVFPNAQQYTVTDLTKTFAAGRALVEPKAVEVSSSTDLNIANGPDGEVTGVTNAPKLLTDADINVCSGMSPSYLAHKIFGHVGYAWEDCDWLPSLKAGAEVTFATCSDSHALNSWGLFVSGGIAF